MEEYEDVKSDTKIQRTFPIIIEQDEDGFFVAINPSLFGCYSQGRTIEEALANVREATVLCLEETTDNIPGASSVSVHLITA
jgi:predicted RNase H-like HicB family nuclease